MAGAQWARRLGGWRLDRGGVRAGEAHPRLLQPQRAGLVHRGGPGAALAPALGQGTGHAHATSPLCQRQAFSLRTPAPMRLELALARWSSALA